MNLPSFTFVNNNLKFDIKIRIYVFCLARKSSRMRFMIGEKVVLEDIAKFAKLLAYIFFNIFE